MSTRYFHIGGTKTGSKCLQSIFRMNHALLLTEGIHYPQGNDEPDNSPISMISVTISKINTIIQYHVLTTSKTN